MQNNQTQTNSCEIFPHGGVVFIAADHAGFILKGELSEYLESLGYTVDDKGAHEFVETDDYPDYVALVAKEISKNPEARGIVIGGSGQGEAIVANRFPHVRTVVFNGQYNPGDDRLIPDEIVLSRQHNDSNILSLGARFINSEESRKAVKVWLETPFCDTAERHVRRLQKIEELTKNI
jgi:ribose 5-phosphate isomerase B